MRPFGGASVSRRCTKFIARYIVLTGATAVSGSKDFAGCVDIEAGPWWLFEQRGAQGLAPYQMR
jgi:hypothetical protein